MVYRGDYGPRSLRRQPFHVSERPMPRIADVFLDCAVYLYPSVEEAQAGLAAGGSGFMISVPSTAHEGWHHLHIVTNSHVVREGESPVVRVNTRDGGMDILDLSEEDWVHHIDGDDIAVSDPDIDMEPYKFSYVSTNSFLTKEIIEAHNIGPGDEVFMVGRFVPHEGRQRNTPTARFGNISMMPWEPIHHPSRGINQESFLVETRSLGGFSGSPVFVHIPAMSARPYEEGFSAGAGPWLLGVDWGHLPIDEQVKWKDDKRPIEEGWVVESNSGQMAVVPAWKLQELLDQEELAMSRQRGEERITERKKSSPVRLDKRAKEAEKPDQPANFVTDAFTKGDFEDALDRVSRPVSPPDPEK